MPLSVGQEAPDFELVGTPSEPIRLSKLRGAKAAVLAFYELAFNDDCTAEMQAFEELMPEFEAAHAEVYGISLDPKGVADAFAGSNGLSFNLLCDTFQHDVCTLYGAWRDDRGVASGHGGMARRITYVIDKQGIVRGVIQEVPPDQHAAEALKVLQQLGQS